MVRFKKTVASVVAFIAVVTSVTSPAKFVFSDIVQSTSLTASAATTYKTGDFSFTLNNGAVTIEKYTGSSSSVTIPDYCTVSGKRYPVTILGTNSFSGVQTMKNVYIPRGVTKIYSNAFYCCRNLEGVYIQPTSQLKEIQYSAFYGCKNLRYFNSEQGSVAGRIEIPKNVTSVGDYAFKGCDKMNAVHVYDNTLTEVRTGAFPYRQGFDIQLASTDEARTKRAIFNGYDPTSNIDTSREYTVNINGCSIVVDFVDKMDASKGIRVKKYNSNPTPTKYDIPSKVTVSGKTFDVTAIGDNFLTDNTTVKEVVIPDSVKKIGGYFCTGATALQKLKLPHNLVTIGTTSLYGCKSLATILYDGSDLEEIGYQSLWCTKWLDDYEKNYPKADAVVLGNYIYKYLGDKHSGNNSSVINIDCGAVYTGDNNKGPGNYVCKPLYSLGHYSFSTGGAKIQTVNLRGVKYINDNAFKENTKLDSIYNTTSVKKMGKTLFSNHTYEKLKSQSPNMNNGQNLIMMGTVIYEWLGTAKTVDLRNTNVTFISKSVIDKMSSVKTLYLPSSAYNKVFFEDDTFANSGINDLYVGSTRFTYDNVKNNSNMKKFYDLNFRGLAGCKATGENFMKPLCKSILSKLGLTYYGGINRNLSVAQQTKIAGTIYRYLANTLHYYGPVDEGCAGEYTLYTGFGKCGPSARAYAYLLYCAGIESCISGSSNHGWTNLKIGGKWFHADACDTWTTYYHTPKLFLRTTDEFKRLNSACHTYNYDHVQDMNLRQYGLVGSYKDVKCDQEMGDVNGDKVADSKDVELMFGYLYKPAAAKPKCDTTFMDLNGDGKINGIDFMILSERAVSEYD